MTETEIKVFLKVAECGSISTAAKEMYLTQPTVSMKIKSLESQLGATLFCRGRGQRNTELTAEGKRFKPYALKWLNLWSSTRAALQETPREILTVSASSSIGAYILPKVFHSVKQSVPNVSFKVWQYHYTETFSMVEEGSADIGLVTNLCFSRDLNIIPLYREDFVCAGKPASGKEGPVHPAELDVRQELYLPWSESYNQWHNYWFRTEINAAVETNALLFAGQLLREEDYWSIVPKTFAETMRQQNGVSYTSIEEKPGPNVVSLICKKNVSEYPAAETILREMRQIVDGLGGTWLYQAGDSTSK